MSNINILNLCAKIWGEMKAKKPLVYHITNYVAINEQAHTTLTIGARPVMAYSPEESEKMCGISNALLLNIGTPSIGELYAMKKALRKANEINIPVLLDPVGYGATEFRNRVVQDLLNSGKFCVIKGNCGEIAALSGISGAVSGVDSNLKENSSIKEIVKSLAEKYKSIIIATGEEDIISNGKISFLVKGGSKMLTYLTGSGCMVGSIISSLLAVSYDYLEASLTGLLAMKIAGKRAELNSKGTGSYKANLYDRLFELKEEDIIKEGEIEKWN
jgi:hydroxyethylthiazole kinase